ncbi:AAA family ATPase [Nafulsella turpanensis]|uniref:AAA family ATPase n=1 Tax=Nafulsella turpanensis TaxID=1265690 RepID=UPI0003460F0C|nr:MoxR family ATPase [Nafulsella turpanensis]
MTSYTEEQIEALITRLPAIRKEIGKVIVGQQEVIDQLLISFLAGGHALLEGVPGLAKTLMIRTLAETLKLSFQRIQFTPDLMPSDIVGTEILEEDRNTGKRFFQFNKGPVFANIILADEINRTPPKTQAALLEAMQEQRVTFAGKTYELPKPYFILATQNPLEQAGTFPLPEAQLDRFLLYILLDYPAENEELQILKSTTGNQRYPLQPIYSGEEILLLQRTVRDLPMSEDLMMWVNKLVRATRPATTPSDYVKEWVRWGAGPRAGQALVLTARARALLKGRLSVLPEDIEAVAKPVLRHRILMNFKAEAEGIRSEEAVEQLLKEISVPKHHSHFA